MDAWETFMNLPNCDKIRFFEALLSKIEKDSNQTETPQVCNSNQSSFSGFLNNLNALSKNASEKNSEPAKKNQKTLDGWLIKRKDGSSSKSHVEQSTSQSVLQSDKRSDSYKVSDTRSLPEQNDTEDVIDDNSKNSVEVNIVSKTRLDKKSVNNVPVPDISKDDENTKLNNENCALRSKRKFSQLSHVSEGDDRVIKHFKKSRKQKDISGINDCKEFRNNKLTNFGSSQGENSDKQNICGRDKSSEKERPYNLRIKKKSTKQLQSDGVNNNITIEENLNSQVDIVTKSNDLQSKYEAFCQLDKECSERGINTMEILLNKNIQTLLNGHKNLCNDAIVFIASLELNSGKIAPVVHLAESKKKLLETLVSMQEMASGNDPS